MTKEKAKERNKKYYKTLRSNNKNKKQTGRQKNKTVLDQGKGRSPKGQKLL